MCDGSSICSGHFYIDTIEVNDRKERKRFVNNVDILPLRQIYDIKILFEIDVDCFYN